MRVSVSTPVQLHVNTHLWEVVSVVSKQSGSPGNPGSPFRAHCARVAAGIVSSPCHAPVRDRKPREQPEECCIWNLCPMHGLVLVSFEKQMLLGGAQSL